MALDTPPACFLGAPPTGPMWTFLPVPFLANCDFLLLLFSPTPFIVGSPYSRQGALIETEIRPGQSSSHIPPVAFPHLENKIQILPRIPMPLMTGLACLPYPPTSCLSTCSSGRTPFLLSLSTYSSGPAWGLCLVASLPWALLP